MNQNNRIKKLRFVNWKKGQI